MTETPLKLFNSLTRQLEEFKPVHPGEARVYSCGPTVYNYQHIGNMRAYVFADTLGRVLSYKGYKLTHVINITDVGHLTSDADEGDDKLEKAAAAQGKTAWDIAAFYQADFEADLARLNIRKPAHPRATEYVDAMIDWGKTIAAKHCYELDSGLYFDVSTVPAYGRLARAVTDANDSGAEGRIDEVSGKRNQADFAIWRKTPAGETRQMEWPSPWGMGAPGWHLECSVMSKALLGMPFDIHTGGIDHREIHHPNEIAQNQAHEACGDSGANIWMHNNFLVERSGKMSKSSGEFLRLQLLIDKGYHPLAYRLMCLQAHYRSELEFSWEGLQAALVRLKRMVRQFDDLRAQASSLLKHMEAQELDEYERLQVGAPLRSEIGHPELVRLLDQFEEVISQDLNTAEALVALDRVLAFKRVDPAQKASVVIMMLEVLGLDIQEATAGFVSQTSLRIRPKGATIAEPEIDAILAQRREARAVKDFATSDRLRDELAAHGVEVMDGDPLGWDWKLGE